MPSKKNTQTHMTHINTHEHTQTHINTHEHTQTHINTHRQTQTHTNTHKHITYKKKKGNKNEKSYKGLIKFDGQFTLCKYTLGTFPKVYLLFIIRL